MPPGEDESSVWSQTAQMIKAAWSSTGGIRSVVETAGPGPEMANDHAIPDVSICVYLRHLRKTCLLPSFWVGEKFTNIVISTCPAFVIHTTLTT